MMLLGQTLTAFLVWNFEFHSLEFVRDLGFVFWCFEIEKLASKLIVKLAN